MKPFLLLVFLSALLLTFFVLQRGNERPASGLQSPVRAEQAPGDPIEPERLDEGERAARLAGRVEAQQDPAEAVTEGASIDDAASARATATLAVRVIDELGVGVARANVVLEPTPAEIPALSSGRNSGTTYVQGSTDRDGWTTLEVTAGRPLELRSMSFGETSPGSVRVGALAAGARAEATIEVRRGADLDVGGRVVAEESGAPIPGVEVRVEQVGGFSSNSRAKPQPLPPTSRPDAITDADGRFRVEVKSWANTVALFTCAGWSPRIARLHMVTVHVQDDTSSAAPETPAEVEVTLLRAAKIEGTVSGAPGPTLARASIASQALIAEDESRDWSLYQHRVEYLMTATVAASGTFALEHVPAQASLVLSLSEAATGALLLQDPAPVRLAPGATHRVDWALGSGGRFDCSVQHASGAPGQDEELWLFALGPARPGGATDASWKPLKRARTDASGRAPFEDVPLGQWVVALAPTSGRPSDTTLRYAVLATMDAPGATVSVPFTLHAGLYISGTIVAPDGTPTSAFLSAASAAFRTHMQESSTKSGRFRLGPLLPGSYRLSAARSGPTPEGMAPLTASDPVFAEAGAEGVELRLKAGCELVLSALDAETGEAVPAEFTVLPQWLETATFTGGFRASATVGGQAPGLYRVLARTEGGLVGVVAAEVGAGERRAVAVSVGAGGSVRVAYGGPARVLHATLERDGARFGLAWIQSGESEVLRAPAGTYTLRTAVREYDPVLQRLTTLSEDTREVTVVAGGEVALDIER